MARSISNSGDGSRPTTSGGVDNIGAGERVTPHRNAVGEEVQGSAPHEAMAEKRHDLQTLEEDDSAPFGLTQNASVTANTAPTPTSRKRGKGSA